MSHRGLPVVEDERAHIVVNVLSRNAKTWTESKMARNTNRNENQQEKNKVNQIILDRFDRDDKIATIVAIGLENSYLRKHCVSCSLTLG